MVNWPDSKSDWPARLCTAADEPESAREREGLRVIVILGLYRDNEIKWKLP